MWRRILLTPASRQLCLFQCAGRACGGRRSSSGSDAQWCMRWLLARSGSGNESPQSHQRAAVVVRSVMKGGVRWPCRGRGEAHLGLNGLAGRACGQGRGAMPMEGSTELVDMNG